MFSYEMLVNCENRLPEDFVPPSLAAPDIAFAADPSDEKRFLEVRGARHAKRLFDAAKAEGIFLYGISGYRDYERQKILYQKACSQIFCRFISMRNCHARMRRTSDRTGLDVSCPAVSLNLSQVFFRNSRRAMACPPCPSLWFYHTLSQRQRTSDKDPGGTMAHPVCHQKPCSVPDTHRAGSGRILRLL